MFEWSGIILSSVSSSLITQVALFLLLPLMIVFSFLIFVFYRQQRENKIKQERLDLELRALRAQINPHFIFNCLNSIYYSIINKQNDQAAHYLLKFSWLTRRILEQSDKKWISLKDELEILDTYLALEKMRTNDAFQFKIEVSEHLNPEMHGAIMLIEQPIIENSIWYGLKAKNGDGMLTIRLESINDQLHFVISDNSDEGDVQSKEELQLGKQRSMGLKLVKDQLESYSSIEKAKAGVIFSERNVENNNQIAERVRIFYPLKELY